MTDASDTPDSPSRTGSGWNLWTRQFGPEYDFPPTEIQRKYVICSTPRSGSHHLAHLLYRRGTFGYPLEYLNRKNIRAWENRSGARGPAMLEYIKRVRTSPNGCFGMKLHYDHLDRWLAWERPEEVTGYRFVFLQRRDLVAQALSYSAAAQTGSWISEVEPRRPPHYDYHATSRCMRRIAECNAGWLVFLESLGVEYLSVFHEDTVAEGSRTIAGIAAFLGVSEGADTGTGFSPGVQARPEAGEWRSRFIAESRDGLLEARTSWRRGVRALLRLLPL